MFRLKRFILVSTAAIIGFGAISCKKDEEDPKYLNGAPEFSLPEFAVPGETLNMKASGVMDEDRKEVDYYWYTSLKSSVKDTSVTYTLVLTDTLVNISVTCTGYRDGYYTSATTKTVSVVSSDRENGSISGKTFDKTKDFTFVDPRDGKDYWCTKIGNTEWFKENLAYEGAGVPMGNTSATAKVFGQFYSWNEAKTACPEGWRLPTLKDWANAAEAAGHPGLSDTENYYGVAGKFMGDLYFNSEEMWEYWPNVKITNSLGLDIMPCGYANVGSDGKGLFQGMYGYSAFWTSDERDEDMAFYRYIYVRNPDIMLGSASKEQFSTSVRCVRDAK